MKLTVLLCLWHGWRAVYDTEHVRPLARMLRQYLRIPHQLALLTDRLNVRKSEVECDLMLPVPPEPRGLRLTSSVNCYRRLRFWDPSWAAQLGTPWLLSVDLDTLLLDDITADVEHGMTHGFGFKIMRAARAGEIGQRPYSGGMYMLEVGRHPHVWESFDPQRSPERVRDSGWVGSDQVWLSLVLPGAPTFNAEDGFYFYDQFLASADDDAPPKMLAYTGAMKPWLRACSKRTPELFEEWRRFAA